jgi:prepilin-type N-terminal cleavage/methylation domain-containing protein
MRCNSVLKSQRGFSLMEVMAAAMVLSIFIAGIGAIWVTGDRRVDDLVLRQKAVFVANMEMERLTTLYDTTSFGVLAPVTTTGYTEVSAFPATRLTYPAPVTPYSGGGSSDFTVTTANAFTTGDSFKLYVAANLLPALNRNYLWLDQSQGVMARVSWSATNVSPNPCTGSDGCGCLSYSGLLGGSCQKIVLYLEYPFRLVSGTPTAGANLQTLTLATIVGRRT